MDALTDVLNSLRLEGNLYCRGEFTAPWSIAFAPSKVAAFHVVDQGEGWLRLDDQAEESLIPLAPGDVLVLPHGRGHILSDSPTTPVISRIAVTENGVQRDCPIIRAGGNGLQTTLVCGAFNLDYRYAHPLLSLLPQLIHIKGEEGRVVEWLGPTLKFLVSEAGSERPGTATIIRRLTDILFIQIVRAWIESQPAGAGGWLGALRDPQIGVALGHIHRDPAHPWTVASLASAVGMSRSAFSARFTTLVGESPLQYLTRWRIHTAASTLRRENLALAELALRVGYESEAAFSKAFKRQFGTAPGLYRRQLQEQAS
jgi:AraC-like DNA-binding protein